MRQNELQRAFDTLLESAVFPAALVKTHQSLRVSSDKRPAIRLASQRAEDFFGARPFLAR